MNFNRIHPIKYLIFSCLSLSTIRVFLEWDMIYMFLIWNLFLAWIPYALASKMHFLKNKFIYLTALALVLLFIPNASYLITDFVHFRKGVHINLWFDLVLFFTYALTGLMLTMYTIDMVATDIKLRFNSILSKMFHIGVFPLIGCGIYVGRVERWNSWDVFVQPFSFISEMFQIITSSQVIDFVSFSVLFGGFCAMFYLLLKLVQQNKASMQVQSHHSNIGH